MRFEEIVTRAFATFCILILSAKAKCRKKETATSGMLMWLQIGSERVDA